MSPVSDHEVGAMLRRLVRSFSAEITPRETATLPPLDGLLAPGTSVYLTFLQRTPWDRTVAAAR